jgi:hypothetical protein
MESNVSRQSTLAAGAALVNVGYLGIA